MSNFDNITFVTNTIVSVSLVLISSYLTSRRIKRQLGADLQKEYDSKFNTKRWEIYLGMNALIHKIYYKDQGNDDSELSLQDNVRLMSTQILLIGSNDVIKAFGSWLKQRQHGDYLEETKDKLHNLIEEMRKDLGLRDSQLEPDVKRNLFPSRRL